MRRAGRCQISYVALRRSGDPPRHRLTALPGCEKVETNRKQYEWGSHVADEAIAYAGGVTPHLRGTQGPSPR